MIKILILLAIIALTTLLGSFLSANKKKRMQVYNELYEFNEQLILNLKFSKKPLTVVAEKYPHVIKILNGEDVLMGRDGEILRDYTTSIGMSDALSQIDYLSGRRAGLAQLKSESEADYKKYSSLYIKIFFMIGVLIAVLIA